jgi:ribosomal protein S26
MAKAYRRGWQHTKKRGRESLITCSFCGRKVPKYKTFMVTKGFRITDPVLRKEFGAKKTLSLSWNKMHACPACARHRGIVRGK